MPKSDPYTPDDHTRFTMRIKTDLFEKVKREAEKDKRSAVKQIEYIIEQHLQNAYGA
jgi:hypothetical protein